MYGLSEIIRNIYIKLVGKAFGQETLASIWYKLMITSPFINQKACPFPVGCNCSHLEGKMSCTYVGMDISYMSYITSV
jgi:hypothetical protein